jgi:hypothetical protein
MLSQVLPQVGKGEVDVSVTHRLDELGGKQPEAVLAGVVDVWVPPSISLGSNGGAAPVAQLFTASALGAVPTEVITQIFAGVAKAAGAALTVTDLVPLPSQDPFGTSSFFFSVGVFLPSFLGGIVMSLLLRRAPAPVPMAATLVLAGCVALIVVAVVDAGLGALVGHAGALIGIGALTSVALSAPTVAVSRVVGPAGAVLALLVFVVLGLPASGGPFGAAFLPSFHRAFSAGLPLTNAVDAVRNASYFGGHALGAHLGTLGIWAGGGFLVLAVIVILEAKSQPAVVANPSPGAGAHSPR